MSAVLDMVIVGAGLSGVGAACRYVTEFPDHDIAILESRDAIGGTWDLFRYPGIRSDSDMLTLGYDFRPWPGVKTLADGPSIRDYVRDTAAEYGIDTRVQFHSRVTAMDFDTSRDVWTLTITDPRDGATRTLETRFVLSCAGYYRYDRGHEPHFEGREEFAGDIIHPQLWPEDLDYAGKRIAVIGSGATAVTLVPELAKTAAHVVQVQRTPSYVASIPSRDPINTLTRRILPSELNYRFNRWKNITIFQRIYRRAQAQPDKARAKMRKLTVKALGKDYPVDVHFNPPYGVWDQRVCMVPDGDMFEAIKGGRASMVTGHIERFERDGIRMTDGSLVEADIIVTATGLEIKFNGGAELSVDGRPTPPSGTIGYKGCMFSGVPNMVSVFGYTNASWTLRADLMSRWTIRLVRFMREESYTRVVPVAPDGMQTQSWLAGFDSGYLQRAADKMPKQGDRMPWLNVQNYKHDRHHFLDEPVAGEGLEFSSAEPTVIREAAE